MAGGQKLVKPDWNRFKPTKAVKAKNQGLTKIGLISRPKARDKRTKKARHDPNNALNRHRNLLKKMGQLV